MCVSETYMPPCPSCLSACFSACTDLRAGESWVPAGESREESCVCLPERWRHRAVQWERGESASRCCSSRQNRPYHCHHLWCCTTGIQTLSLCTAHRALLIPRLAPGTAVARAAVVGNGTGLNFFSLTGLWGIFNVNYGNKYLQFRTAPCF